MTVFSFLSWTLFAVLCGRIEAFFFYSVDHQRLDTAIGKNNLADIHVGLTALRLAAALAAVSAIGNLLYLVPMALVFPMLHDGYYYMTMNNIDPKIYPKRFRDRSRQTTAIFSLGFKARVIAFVLGILSFALMVYATRG